MRHLSVSFKIILVVLLIAALLLQYRWEPWFGFLHDPVNERLRYFVEAISHFFLLVLTLNLSILFLISIYRRRKRLKPGQVDNVVIGLQNIYYVLLSIGILLAIAASFGYPPGELFTSLSIVAAAIAIISKDYISEIISGMILTFSKELSIDDYVKIGDQKGKIIDITLTKIALLNDDDDVIFLPNNKVYTSDIVNYTKKEIRKVSIEFEINIQGIKRIDELESDLIDVLSDYQEHIEPASYNLKVVDIRKDSLDLKFQYVLHRINRDLEREIRRKTVRRVVDYVKLNLSRSQAEKLPNISGKV